MTSEYEIYTNQDLTGYKEDNSKIETSIQHIDGNQSRDYYFKTPPLKRYYKIENNIKKYIFLESSAATLLTKARHLIKSIGPITTNDIRTSNIIKELARITGTDIFGIPTNQNLINFSPPDTATDNRFIILPTNQKLIPYVLAYASKAVVQLGDPNLTGQAIPPFIGDETTVKRLSQEQISLINTFYLNSLFFISDGHLYTSLFNRMVSCPELSDVIDLWDEDHPTLNTITDEEVAFIKSIDAKEYTTFGFFFLASPSKLQAQPDHMKEWTNKRVTPLLTSCKFLLLGPPPTLNIQHDLGVLASFLDSNVTLRRSIYTDILYSNMNDNTFIKGLISQLKLIIEYTNLTTFRITLAFANACETEVHLIDDIITQCEYVIAQDAALKTIRQDYKYLYFTQDLPNEIQVHNFPDLAYAAFIKKKTDVSTFKNYADIKHEGVVSKRRIEIALTIPLEEDNQGGGPLSNKVSQFLATHKKKPKLSTSQSAANILAQLQAIMTPQAPSIINNP